MSFLENLLIVIFVIVFVLLIVTNLLGEPLSSELFFLRCWYYVIGFIVGWVLHKNRGKNGI